MFLYRLFRAILFLLCKLFFHFEAQGRQHLPKNGGFVLASNHASFLDPILLGISASRVLNFAARESLFKNKFFGFIIFRVGAFPIKRWSADLAAVRESVRRLKNNSGLVVFPEGTRSEDGNIHRFTHGFVLLAKKAGVPVVPARIFGSGKAWGKGSGRIRPAKVRIVFGRPVLILPGKDYADIAEDIRKNIASLSYS